MADDATNITTSASSAKKASGDQGSVEVHSVGDQIAADRYNESKKRSRKTNKFAGMLSRSRPPGATG